MNRKKINGIKNVLSVFDGISCGQIALNRAGIEYENYYASEIDKHAIKICQKNYPDTIQLGSVVDVDVSKLPPIDWYMGGSPCQSFSFAGKRKGMSTTDAIEILTLDHYLDLKSQNYEFEGQSYLFWEYMRILTDIRKYNPNVIFFLENVEMGDKWEKVLSRAIGVNGIHINSALVSAQSRPRIYWTNLGLEPQGLFGDLASVITQPKDRDIYLKDILQTNVDEKYYLSNKMYSWLTKHSIKRGNPAFFKKLDGSTKASCLTTTESKQNLSNDIIITDVTCAASRGRNPENPKSREAGLQTEQHLEERADGKTICLTSVAKDNYVVEKGINEVIQLNDSTESGGKQPYQQNRVYDTIGKAPCLNTDHRSPAIQEKGMIELGNIYDNGHNSVAGRVYSIRGKSSCLSALGGGGGGGGGAKTGLYLVDTPIIHQRPKGFNKGGQFTEKSPLLTTSSWEHNNSLEYKQRIRRLTEIEAERLQTIEDNYTEGISSTQRYRALGNGWNVDTIVYLFKYFKG